MRGAAKRHKGDSDDPRIAEDWDEEEKRYSCLECRQRGGYLKKIHFLSEIMIEGQAVKEGFVHPVCAMAFPNLYQWGSPESMEISLCQEASAELVYSYGKKDW